MNKISLTPEAIRDLEKIFLYTADQWSIKQAIKYQDEFNLAFNEIVKLPSIGKKYYFRKGNYRKQKVGKHLIFYKLKTDECLVVRILHERMDLNNIFQ